MATNNYQEKLEHMEEEEEDADEEVLSLCDLPVNLIDDEDNLRKPDSHIMETQEEFVFHSRGGLFSKESEMCAADEVFFQGQILPLSFSLTTTTFHRDGRQCNRCEPRSDEYLDLRSKSSSSRSSSLRSQNSLSSSSCSTTTTTPTIPKPNIKDQFHTHSSPKPQLRVTIPTQASLGNQRRKSPAWELFHLGVVPAPDIALQELKVRNTNSANKNHVSRSSGSSNINVVNAKSTTNNNVEMSYDTNHNSGKRNHIFKQLVGKGGGLWNGCKCSVETVQSNIITIRSVAKSTQKAKSTTHAVKEKVLELKRQKHRQKQGKKTMSRHRTVEWIKELSHASYRDEEALLSNS